MAGQSGARVTESSSSVMARSGSASFLDVRCERPRKDAAELRLGEGGSKTLDDKSRPPHVALNYFIDITCATN